MTKSQKKRIPLVLKIIIGFIIIFIVLIAIIGWKFSSEQKNMSPLETKELVSGIFSINNGYVNMYLLKDDDGYIMIDAGVNTKKTLEELNKLHVSPDKIKFILLTHSDIDHTSSLSLFPYATIYLPESEVQMIDGTTKRNFIVGNKLDRQYLTLHDKEEMYTAGFSIICIEMPGHTPGSMSFLVNGKYLFVGDSMSLKDGKVNLFNSFFNMDDKTQEQSIKNLAQKYLPQYIFTAHYGYTDNAEQSLIDWK